MKSKYFKIQEFVSPEIYNSREEKAWQLIDDRLIETMDAIRANLNRPVTINSYCFNGNRKQSGLRDRGFYKSDKDYINSLSQHKYGRGCDFLVKGMEAYEVRAHILANLDKYPHIKFLEVGKGMSWCHIDVRNRKDLVCWDMNTELFVSASEVIKNKL